MAAVFGGCARACAGLAKGCASCGKVTCKGCFKCGKATCQGCFKCTKNCCKNTLNQCKKCCKRGKKGGRGRSRSRSRSRKNNEDGGDWDLSELLDAELDEEELDAGAEQGDLPPLLLTMNREAGAAPDPNVCVTCGARVESLPS